MDITVGCRVIALQEDSFTSVNRTPVNGTKHVAHLLLIESFACLDLQVVPPHHLLVLILCPRPPLSSQPRQLQNPEGHDASY